MSSLVDDKKSFTGISEPRLINKFTLEYVTKHRDLHPIDIRSIPYRYPIK